MAKARPEQPAVKCQAVHPETGEQICDRAVWNPKEKRCIFHSQKKPVEDFKQAFLLEVKRANEEKAIKVFDGICFIFPPGPSNIL
jgi:hypothetical protein